MEPHGLSESGTWPGGLCSPIFLENRVGFEDESSGEAELSPDLKAYFQRWNMKDGDVVVLCRAYASYLDRSSKANNKDI